MLPSTLTKLTVQQVAKEAVALLFVKAASAGVVVEGGLVQMADFRVAGLGVDEYEAADGSVRNHGIALCKLDSETVAVRNQLHNVLLQCVVRTACVPCCRLDYLHPFDAGTGKLFLEVGVNPAGNGLCKSDFDGAQEHGLV